MTNHHREPVDPDLLADTIRLFGTAIEYHGQVFNPADVLIHTNGATDAHRISLVWSVVNRWTRPDCAPTTDEARQLLAEIREMLTAGQPPSDCERYGHDPDRCLATIHDQHRPHGGWLPDGTIVDPRKDQT